MKSYIYRFSAVLVLVASMAVSAAPALAGGGYDWTDISDKIAERTNRPVWAIAYASPYWYLTDGQELWSGGHVWRTEGTTMADITTDVRNAGISRVDDIVSDGQTVLFLKNVVAANNNFEAVRAMNDNYQNVTSNLRQTFASNEGIRQIIGRSGTWYAVTTKRRLLKLDGNNFYPKQIALPSALQNQISSLNQNDSGSDGIYDVKSEGWSVYLPWSHLSILPADGNTWIVFAKGLKCEWSFGCSAAYKLNGDSFSELTTLDLEAESSYFAASNGAELIFETRAGMIDPVISLSKYSTANGTIQFLSKQSGVPRVLNYGMLVWDGNRWFGTAGKQAYSIENGLVYDFGQLRDYFITGAGNGNGTILLGGAVSELGNPNPTNPLILKLVKLTSGGTTGGTGSTSGTFGGGKTYTSYSGPNLTTSGNPSDFEVGNGETFVYRAVASDSNGIDRIELYVNSARVQTCYADTCEYSNIYYTNGLSTRAIPLMARAYDRQGYATESSNENLTVNQYSTSGGTSGQSNNTYFWTWTEPNNATVIKRGDTLTFNVGANDADGLNRIEIVVNGAYKRTCDFSRAYGNQTCSLTIYGSDYSVGSQLAVNAKITDYSGSQAWTPLQYLTIQDSGNSGNTVYSLSPADRDLQTNENFLFTINASNPDGLNRIDIYVNDNKVQTCDYSYAYGNRECTYRIYGSNYPVGSNLYVYAKVTDSSYNTIQTYNRNYRIVSSGSSNGGTGDYPATWSWSDPNQSQVSTSESVVYHVGAWDNDGLNRIDIYVNGILAQSCNFGTSNAYGNRECQFTLNGGNYKNGDQVYVNAKAVDAQGRESWASARTYSVTGGLTSYNNRSSWIWSDPNVSEIYGSQNVTFYVGAWAQNGIRKIEIIGNGAVMKTCDLGYNAYGNQQCSIAVATTSPGTTYVSYSGRITDGNGNIFNSDTKSFTIRNGTTQTSDVGGTVSMTSDHDSGYDASDTIKFSATGQDSDGLDRLELMVNGRLVKTCYTESCSFTGGPYADRTSVTYGARLVDSKGYAYFTGYKTIYKK